MKYIIVFKMSHLFQPVLPCIFVRLTYCNLRCSYCDTEYAFYEGKNLEINQIIEKVNSFKCNLVE